MKSDLPEYSEIIEQSPQAIVICNEDDQVLFANKKAVQWFGGENGMVSLHSIYSKQPKKWQKLKSLALDAKPALAKVAVLSNGPHHIDVTCKLMSTGNQKFFVSFISDISEQQTLEDALTTEKNIRELILDSLPAMVFVKDTENRILSVNRAYSDVTGLSLENIEGKNVIQFMKNKELAQAYWKDDLEVIETGMPKRNIIEPMITDDKRWFITDKIPYRNEKGKIIGIIGFSIDITERKNAEDALIRSQRKLRLLFDTSPDGIVICDLQGNLLDANLAFRNLLGFEMNEITNLGFVDITPQQYRVFEEDFIMAALNSGQDTESAEKEYISKSNVLIPVKVTCWMLKDEQNNPLQMVANVQDLTFEKKAEQLERYLLQKEKEKLEMDLQTKTQQLNIRITQLVEINELINSVINKLQSFKGEYPKTFDKKIDYLIHDLRNRSREDFWTQFETTFGQINQSFYNNIYKAFPNLTNNERKISAFLRMNLSTKEIANITHQSIRSIEMARSRLRKKLKISRSDNLSKFLNQF